MVQIPAGSVLYPISQERTQGHQPANLLVHMDSRFHLLSRSSKMLEINNALLFMVNLTQSLLEYFIAQQDK